MMKMLRFMLCSFIFFPVVIGLITKRMSLGPGKLSLATRFNIFSAQPSMEVNVQDVAAGIDGAKSYSFVTDELRPYAMKLHTRDQAPKEGQQKAQTPFTQWEVSRANYLQFLVDSLAVYDTLETLVESDSSLASLRNNGLERKEALKADIQWMLEYDNTLSTPICGVPGITYSNFLKELCSSSKPKFMCHYYNHYFAHTAGGRMIGKKMADKLLDGKILKFYEWEGDVKELLEKTKMSIDEIAVTWNAEEKQACLEETMACFRFGGMLMSSMKPPQ